MQFLSCALLRIAVLLELDQVTLKLNDKERPLLEEGM